MKKIMAVIWCLFIFQIGIAQGGFTVVGGLTTLKGNPNSPGPFSVQPTVNASPAGNVGTLYSESSKYDYNKTTLDGSQYLFEEWKNQGLILVGEKKYVIPNINFNMDKQVFMSKFADSVLVYDFKHIDKILVNDKLFKSVYNSEEGTNKVYEILYSSQEFSIFKENFITVTEASPNPMLNRPNRKVKQKYNYFVYSKGVFKPFKLKKAEVLGLLSDEEMKQIQTYAETNKLSYSKAGDVDKMFAYINKS